MNVKLDLSHTEMLWNRKLGEIFRPKSESIGNQEKAWLW
jgi:hypothetical protein